VRGAEALLVLTEWREFIEADWEAVAHTLQGEYVFDGRNALDRVTVESAGCSYEGIGV
jgi:UDPglucose 6-dehydrogenase